MLAKLPSILLLADVEFVPPQQPRPGAAGRRTFTFLPTRIGDGDIRLVSVRPFAPNPPGSTATYHVHVVRGRGAASATDQAR
jgi:chagasin family peptidase inhibitor I42